MARTRAKATGGNTDDADKSTDASGTIDTAKLPADNEVISKGKPPSNSTQDNSDGNTPSDSVLTPDKSTVTKAISSKVATVSTANSGKNEAKDNINTTDSNSTKKSSTIDTAADVITGGDRAEDYIMGTNPGRTVKMSPTVAVCFVWKKGGKLVAENVNQAVPADNKLKGLLELISTGKSGEYNALNDSQMHLHFSKKPLAEDGDVNEWVSWYFAEICPLNVFFCKMDQCTIL